ncbi:unnamed protein product, partial [marine sediment metagenome]
EALIARQGVVMKQMQLNWRTLVGGTPGGYVDSSFGQSTELGENKPNSVVGTVGVYKLDSVDSTFGKTDSDLNAAQIAYWVEFGSQRLKSGQRKLPAFILRAMKFNPVQ